MFGSSTGHRCTPRPHISAGKQVQNVGEITCEHVRDTLGRLWDRQGSLGRFTVPQNGKCSA